jgi:hypothetical protein
MAVSRWIPRWVSVVVVSTVACGGDPTAPEASEPVPSFVVHRDRIPGERLPVVEISAVRGEIRVKVVRKAFCQTLVDAHIERRPGEIDVVTRVSDNPAALCLANFDFVVEYTMTIAGVDRGSWDLRVFEGVGQEAAKFLDDGRVSVPD